MFYKLDINEFFDKKYENVNNNNGIGGMGFITNNQVIHVYNDKGYDKVLKKEYLGFGDHLDITNSVLSEIYNIPKNLVDDYLSNLIAIKYWNSESFKIITMSFPKSITLNEYKYLVDLQYYYKEIFDKNKIIIAAYLCGNDVTEYGPEVQATSEFEPIIKYAKNRLDTNLDRNIKERLLKL